MGKGTIESGGIGGKYSVKLLLRVESIIAEQEKLAERLAELQKEIKAITQQIEDLIVDEGDPEEDDEGDPEEDDEGDPEEDDEGDPEEDDESEAGTYTMEGQVFDGVVEIPDINVTIFWYNAGQWKNIHTFNTNINGQWTITTIAEGKYKIRAEDNLGNYATMYWPNKKTLSSATIIDLAGDRNNLDIFLESTILIQGKVADV